MKNRQWEAIFYEVKRSTIVKVALFGFLFITPGIVALSLDPTVPNNQRISMAILLMMALIAAGIYKTGFEIRDNELRFKQGVFIGWTVSLQDISRAKEIPVPKLQQSASYRCISVEAKGKQRLVFVLDPKAFLKELSTRSPQLHFYGEELRCAPEPILSVEGKSDTSSL